MMKSALGAAVQPVLDGRCSVGIIGPLPEIPNTLTSERFSEISFLMVAARDHPLTLHKGKIPKEALSKHNQIVLTDRSDLSAGRELGVMSPTTSRLADLFAKHHFILNGLGWGGMPCMRCARTWKKDALRYCKSRTFLREVWFCRCRQCGRENHRPDPRVDGLSSA
jgi:DNA-binding transcriptional LysR family regulator